MLAVLERQHAGTPAADCISARMGELRAKAAADKAAEEVERKRAAAEAERQRLALLDKQEEARKAAEAEAQRICVNVGGILNLEVLGALANLHKGSPAAVCIADRIALLRKQEVTAPSNPTKCRFVEALVGNEQRCLKPKDTFKDCPDCPEMVVIPVGRFTMGSSSTERDRSHHEGPQHEVTIGNSFAVGRSFITRGDFAAFVSETKHDAGGSCYLLNVSADTAQPYKNWRMPGFAQDDQHPAVCVNWDDAKAFASWLSKKTSKIYRLLTEAEREYVTRAGSTTRYSFGDDEKSLCRYGNVADRTAKRSYLWTIADCDDGYTYTAPVGKFAANAFGVYDVHGNVWDWTEDCWHDTYQGAPTDGSAWTTASGDWTSGNCITRAVRGGSWFDNPPTFRSAVRLGRNAKYRYSDQGFRLARTLSP